LLPRFQDNLIARRALYHIPPKFGMSLLARLQRLLVVRKAEVKGVGWLEEQFETLEQLSSSEATAVSS
jgi:hypothetical protein